MESTGVNDLGLTATNESACSCCATAATPPSTEASAGAVTLDVLVEGMTCSHCVMSVTEELSEIEGVADVSVELNPGGASKVSIASSNLIDPQQIRDAVEGAGYTLAGGRS
jgi:copper chaperone